MNKLAVFVEGYTEVVFVEKLINEIAGRNKVLIHQIKIQGGRKARRTIKTIKAARSTNNELYYVLIVDCGGDNLVKTRIREEHENLTKSGYSKIIGLRDVRPDFTYTEIPRLEINLPKYIKGSLTPVTFILSIMEIEAWFLSEATHFKKIDPSITIESIQMTLGFNPQIEDMQQRTDPAEDLANCYKIGGKTYLKGRAENTINVLDYALIYAELQAKIRYLKLLIDEIDTFLS